MTLPAVTITELDGNIGTLPSGTTALAIVGVSDSGVLDTPAAFSKKKDVIASYVAGPLVEFACTALEKFKRPVILVRTGQTTAASCDTINVTGVTGTSVVTLGADTTPNDEYEAYIKVKTGGTIGVAGIVLSWSLNNGRESTDVALGTATSFVFPNSGGIGVQFAAGTLIANDVIKYRTFAPKWNTTELGTAITALKNSTLAWDICAVVGTVDASAFDTLATLFANTEKMWIGNTVRQTLAQTEVTYKSALDTAFSAKADTYGSLNAGYAKVTSGNTFRRYSRPVSWALAPLIASVDESVDIAQIDVGLLTGVDIRDDNGNADEHDELINPGLDDSRFCVLRSHDGIAGVYPNNPRLFSASGSDFQFVQHRRIMNLTKRTVRIYFQRRLSKPVIVDANTGYILESEALEIESGVEASLRAVLMVKPKASGGGFPRRKFFQLSRTDNLLSTSTMTGQCRVVPLAYPKFINIDVGFFNPALKLVTA